MHWCVLSVLRFVSLLVCVVQMLKGHNCCKALSNRCMSVWGAALNRQRARQVLKAVTVVS